MTVETSIAPQLTALKGLYRLICIVGENTFMTSDNCNLKYSKYPRMKVRKKGTVWKILRYETTD